MASQIAHINGAGTVSGKADLVGPRKAKAGGRKPLGDLTNARKPMNHSAKPHALDVKNKSSSKPRRRVRDLNIDEIGEEICFHDHQKCVKSQLDYESVDVDQFFKTLENDLNDGFTIYFPPKKMKFEIGIESMLLEELPEELPAMRSPVCPGTPESTSSSSMDYLSNFSVLNLDLKLINSP